MKLTVTVNRAEALRRGFATDSNSVLLEPGSLSELDQKERALIAERLYERPLDWSLIVRARQADSGELTNRPIVVPEPTLEGLLEAISKEDAAARLAREEREAEIREAVAAAERDALQALNDDEGPEGVDWSHYRYPCRSYHGKRDREYREAYNAVGGVKERREQVEREQTERKEARELERQRQAEAKLDELRRWVREYGSERARLLLEEEHGAWVPVAADEWCVWATPPGYAPLERASIHERTKPTAADIHALRHAREHLEARDVRLVWVQQYRPGDPDDPEDVERMDGDGDILERKYSALEVTLRAPHREVYREVYREIEQEPTP